MSSITVFCGSKSGNHPIYIQHAKELGKLLAQHNIKLIYGAGSVGLMGAMATECMENGGEVVGIIPQLLVDWEQQHTSISESIVTTDMHERKKLLFQKADAAIILAGGYGTLDELFEMITWNNLKIHAKKVYILNSNGFYNNLLAHLTTMQNEGFLYEDWKTKIIICETPQQLIDLVK